MGSPRHLIAFTAATLALASVPSTARAIPAFARKYGTSCETCHTVYPKLTPFGEAFRRNGYRFPGVDSDIVKQETVPLGQDAAKQTFPNSVWPGTVPASVPIAVGFNGQATFHPDTKSGGAAADNNVMFTSQDLVAEAHMWIGGSYDDNTTFWGEVTFADGGIDIEHAQVLFNDLIGPKHAVNAVVGRGFQTLQSYGPHSSYVADTILTAVPVTALYGASSDSFNLVDNYNGAEVNGVLGGRFDYSLGLNAGANIDVRPTENVYAHVGYKLGGMRLDGEGAAGPTDPMKPWSENAITLDAFAYHSNSRIATGDPDAPTLQQDVSLTMGGQIRAQYASLELNVGAFQENHSRATSDQRKVSMLTQYNELSYVAFPWLVPAIRVEYLTLTPDGGSAVNDLRITPGIAALIRPNLKVTLAAQLEQATGMPDGGWGAAGGMAAPSDATSTVSTEIESVWLGLATAF